MLKNKGSATPPGLDRRDRGSFSKVIEAMARNDLRDPDLLQFVE